MSKSSDEIEDLFGKLEEKYLGKPYKRRPKVLLLKSTASSFGHMVGVLRLAVNLKKMNLYHQYDTSPLIHELMFPVSRIVPSPGQICYADGLSGVMGGCTARTEYATFFPESPWFGGRGQPRLNNHNPAIEAEFSDFGKEQERLADEQ